MTSRGVLYSWYGCPYALRARLALLVAGIPVELREINLRAKPAEMIAASSKQKPTVPTLVLQEGRVIEESIEVVLWAAEQAADDALLPHSPQAMELIEGCDEFDQWVGRWKNPKYNTEHPREYYRDHCLPFLHRLEATFVGDAPYLLGCESPGTADVTLWPFVRKFVNVDRKYFRDEAPLPRLAEWFALLNGSHLVQVAREKNPVWTAEKANGVLLELK